MEGRTPGPHTILGIDVGFVPDVLRLDLIDEVDPVTDAEAVATTRRLAKKEGLVVGTSTGVATWAALKVAARPENEGKLIAVILPDSG